MLVAFAAPRAGQGEDPLRASTCSHADSIPEAHSCETEAGQVVSVIKAELEGGQRITASITKRASDDLGLTVGGPVTP